MPRKMSMKDRVETAVFGAKFPRKRTPKVSEKWFRKNPVTMNSKLRQAILDVLPFDLDKQTADLVLRTIFDVILEKVITEGRAVIPKFGALFLKKKRKTPFSTKHHNLTVAFEVNNRFRQTYLRDPDDGTDTTS